MGAETFISSACADSSVGKLFENLPPFVTPKRAAELVLMKSSTFYDMKYRPDKYGVPAGMFLKRGKHLLVDTKLLRAWFESRLV